MLESARNRWFEFIRSLRMQLVAALAVGLPADETPKPRDRGADEEGEAGFARPRPVAGETARRYRNDSAGYLTRNGLGSLEVGSFRERPGD